MLIPFVAIAAFVILVIYFLVNKKEVEQEKEGLVKDILKKDALVVEFGEGTSTVVKFFGITLAADSEMLDDSILTFFDENLRGMRVSVKPRSVGTGDVVVGEVRTLGGEYVNALLARQGFARWSPVEASGDTELFDAQELAKAEKLGVWNPAVRQLAEENMRSHGAEESLDASSFDSTESVESEPKE